MQYTPAGHALLLAVGFLLSCQPQQKPPHDTTKDSLPTDTQTHTGDTDSAPYVVGSCPPYSGLDVAENPWEAHVTYLVNEPPYQANEVTSTKDRDGTDFTIVLQPPISEAAHDYLYFPQHYTSRTWVEGQIEARCDEEGYWESGRTLTWTLQDLFDRYTLTTTTTVTWDPPILVVPANLGPGTSWDIDTTQTTQFASGASFTETIRETRTGIRIETTSWSSGGMQDDALLVESTTGHRLWYHKGYGLVRGDGLTAAGGGYGIDDTE